jgi:hypothetical protein
MHSGASGPGERDLDAVNIAGYGNFCLGGPHSPLIKIRLWMQAACCPYAVTVHFNSACVSISARYEPQTCTQRPGFNRNSLYKCLKSLEPLAKYERRL